MAVSHSQDPKRGRARLSDGEGNARISPVVVIRRVMADNFGAQKWLYGIAIVAMVIAAGATSATAWIMNAIFGVLSGAPGAYDPYLLSAAVLMIFVVRGAASYVQSVTLSRAGNSVVSRLQRRVFDKLLQQEADWFESNDSSSLLVRVTQSARAARNVIDIVVTTVSRDALTLVGLVCVMVWQNALLSTVFLFILPLALLGVRVVLGRVRNIARDEIGAMAEITKVLRETSLGLRVVRSFGLERLLRVRMARAVKSVELRQNSRVRLESVTMPMMDTLAGLAIAAIIVVSTFGGRVGTATSAGEVMSFITALLMAYEPAKRLSRVRVTLETACVGVRMMFTVLDRPDALVDAPDAVPLAAGERVIAFRNVTFGYGKRKVLKDLSLDFAPGKVTAIVGPSGGGKSTIMSLLLRLYEPDSGAIEVDGLDLRKITRASWRDNLSYAGQNTFLFSASVRENLRMGRENATNAEIEAAAKLAQAHEFITALPDGYDTEVGENGSFLSGGQRQRISLARAIVKDAPILLMDEATSALDNHSEGLVRDAIRQATAGRTTVLIAHRLSTVLAADEVMFIEGGRLVEQGPLETLMQGDTRFAALFNPANRTEKEGQDEAEDMAI